MPPDKIQPTRSGLLIVRRQLALAKRIHRLLSMKLDGMMLELTKLAEQAALHRRVLEKRYTGAREMAAVATMMEGEPECSLQLSRLRPPRPTRPGARMSLECTSLTSSRL